MQDDSSLTSRSIDVICGLQEEAGGFLATSRDDAYPFVYPRDGSFMSMALNAHGLFDRSMRFFEFLSKVRRPRGELLQRYNKGQPSVSQKGESDVTPIVIQGIYDTYASSNDLAFLKSAWKITEEGVGFVLECIDRDVGLVHTTRSIHETRSLEEGFEIWTNSAAARGLLYDSLIAAALGYHEAAEKWLSIATELWSCILECLYDHEVGMFIKNLRRDVSRIAAPDISQLSPFYFGLCQDDETLERTLAHLKQTLWNWEVGGVNRFRDFELVSDWHWYTGGTKASWPLFTLWMARFYGRLGDSKSMEECLDFVRRASTREMGIPEKVAPTAGYVEWKENETDFNERVMNGISRAEGSATSIPGYVPWACPLGWSHAEYLMLGRNDEATEIQGLLGYPAANVHRS